MEQHDEVANLHCTNTAEPLPHGLDESGFLAEEQIPMFSSHGLVEKKPTVPSKKYWTITILLFAATWIAFGTGLMLSMKSKQMINMEHSRTSGEFNSLQDQDKTLNSSLNGKINSLQQQVDIFNSRLNGEFNSLQDQGETLNSSLNGKINSLQQQVDTFNSRFNGEFNSLQDQDKTLNSSLNGKINSLQQQVDTFNSRFNGEFNSLQDQDETLNSSLNGKINSLQQQVDTFNSRFNGEFNSLQDQSETLNSSLNGKINSLQQQVDIFNSRFNGEFNSLQDQDETLNSSLNGKINSLQQQVDTFNSRLNGTINSLRPRVDTLNSRLNALARRIRDASGWISFKGYQYKDTVRGHTWQEGQVLCRSWGGDLAHHGMRSWDSRKTIAEALSAVYFYWIGASDLETEGIWKWTNGQNVANEQLLWASGQPTNGTNRHCAGLYLPGVNGTKLQDTSHPNFAKAINQDCREISNVLCERRL